MEIPNITYTNNPSYFNFLKNYYKWKGIILVIQNQGKINLRLPFIQRKNKWIYLPHSSATGNSLVHIIPYINNILCQISTKDLHLGIKKITLKNFKKDIFSKNTNNVKWEIRSFEKLSPYVYSNKVISYLNLKTTKEVQFKSYSSGVKRKIKKACKNGITICKTSNNDYVNKGLNESKKILTDFHHIYSQQMNKHGSPSLSHKYFQNLFCEYKNGYAECFVAYYQKILIGGAFSLSYENQYENCWFATHKNYNRYYSSYALHWAMICSALEHQMTFYSFGRSTKNSGVHKYKKQWGTTDQQIFWNYSYPKKKNIREQKWCNEIWKKLPLFITKIIGPTIAKRIY